MCAKCSSNTAGPNFMGDLSSFFLFWSSLLSFLPHSSSFLTVCLIYDGTSTHHQTTSLKVMPESIWVKTWKVKMMCELEFAIKNDYIGLLELYHYLVVGLYHLNLKGQFFYKLIYFCAEVAHKPGSITCWFSIYLLNIDSNF